MKHERNQRSENSETLEAALSAIKAASATSEAEPATSEAEQENPKSKIFLVAKGRAMGTKSRGVITEGKPVTPEDFEGGQARIDALVVAGYVEG